ncbi:MAG TPA: hypothetical protein VEQ66_06830 [Propionibacteriaceae bacterium]|nr:hypothetical protein [Propionibacteriaceae bacterium]
MLDEEYPAQQIPAYGDPAQPALVTRMAPQLRMTQAGVLAAALSVALSAFALSTFPNFAGSTGRGWAVAALVTGLAMLALCVLQLICWSRAMKSWRGEQSFDLSWLTRVSWVVHLLSYPVVLMALWACIAGSLAAGQTGASPALLAFALLLEVVAQVLAGVQYLRVSGPSGTIPAHLRRLSEAIRRNR